MSTQKSQRSSNLSQLRGTGQGVNSSSEPAGECRKTVEQNVPFARSLWGKAVLPLAATLILSLAACNGAGGRGVPIADVAEAPTPLRFTEVTEEAGLGGFRHDNGAFGEKWFPEQMGAGGGFLDYDGDGWLDVLLVGGGGWEARTGRSPRALRLYRNLGDGTFEEATEAAGLDGIRAFGTGIVAADYDGDGDEDVFFTALGPNRLLRNDPGSGPGQARRFTDVTAEADIVSADEWSSSAIFFDGDRDGDLDLYVGGYARWSPETDVYCSVGGGKVYCAPDEYYGMPGHFYVNEGDGTFREATREAGFYTEEGKSLGIAELDFNGDGWSDLVVVNDGEGDLLYENNRDGTFTEKGVASGFAYDENGAARAGMGVDAGVVDSSGQVSVFVGNFSSEMIGVYKHLGGGLFLDRAAVSKVGYPSLPTLTFGLFLFDADLDADLDLFAANGHVYPDRTKVQENIEYRQRSQLFLGYGDGTFDEAPADGALAQKMVARGAAYADYDRDGDLDVLITENNGSAHLWRNDLNPLRHPGVTFLRVELEGAGSEALGARVEVVTGGLRQERRVRTGSGYLSQSEKVVTFGLGGAPAADSLVVHWPDGRVDRHTDVSANRHLLVRPGAALEEVPLVGARMVAVADPSDRR